MDIGPQQLMYLGNTWQLLLVLLVVLVLFGQGKVSDFMGEFGKGIKNFKKGLSEDSETPPPAAASSQAKSLEHGGVPSDAKVSQTTETKV